MKTNKDRFGRNYYTLILANAFINISFYTITPVLTKYLTDIGISLVIASVISGLFSLTALCTRPFTGIFADAFQPKKILCVSIPMLIFSMMGYAVTTNEYLIVLFRIINGIAFCFNGTTINVFASKYIPNSRMGEGIGYLGLGQVVATAIGPVIGISVGEAVGYRCSFIVAASISIISLLLVLSIRDAAPAEAASSIRKQAFNRQAFQLHNTFSIELLPLAFLNGIFSYANGTVSNFLALLSAERGIGNYSAYFTVLALSMMVLRPVSGKLNDKYGLSFLLIPAYLLAGVGMFLLAGVRSLPTLLLAAVFLAFGQGGGQPAIQSHCIKSVSPARRGVAISTYYIFADVFQGLGPISGGFIADNLGYAAPFLFSGGFLGLGLLIYLMYRRGKAFRSLTAANCS